MLLTEMLRDLSVEPQRVENVSSYTSATSTHDWTTQRSETLTLTKTCLVELRFRGTAGSGEYGAVRAVRNSDGKPLLSTGGFTNQNIDRVGWFLLPAGTIQIDFQTAMWQTDGQGITVTNIYLYVTAFSDMAGGFYTGSVAMPATDATATVYEVNHSFTVRKTPLGQLKNAKALLVFYMTNTFPFRGNNPRNVGEGNSGFLDWKLYVNETQVSWDDHRADNEDGSSALTSTGVGAYGTYNLTMLAGTTYEIKVTCMNDYGLLGGSLQLYFLCIICPWLITAADYIQPLTLAFPPGSTMYVKMEPLTANNTKDMKLGKERSYDSADAWASSYYKSVSGAGLLDFDYTSETYDPTAMIFQVRMQTGGKACISMLGVDVR